LKKTLEDVKLFHVHGLTEYCENVPITESDLQIQCNPHQNSNEILQRKKGKNPKISVKDPKIEYSNCHQSMDEGSSTAFSFHAKAQVLEIHKH
jgi:hypothetical protein